MSRWNGMHEIDRKAARRLALLRAGLLKPEWAGLPRNALPDEAGMRKAALAIISHFGYLQLDTVSIAGARSHSLVLMSRLDGFDPALAEELLGPGEPLFEYWGHEASWMPIELYPTFAFRREDFRHHPWWGDLVGQHPDVARDLLKKVRDEGPIRSSDMEGKGGKGWWELKLVKKVATALWSSGELAIAERRGFQRTYDLAERVIPEHLRKLKVPEGKAIESLLLKALEGHGWASAGTMAQTWRLRRKPAEIKAAIARLREMGNIVPCRLRLEGGRSTDGWVRPADLELAGKLENIRPRRDTGVLLSPFDPILWDRGRVRQLFGFEQVLEIFKPSPKRVYGYFCLPVLAGEKLVARMDLKADRKAGRLRVLSFALEKDAGPTSLEASRAAISRFASALSLTPNTMPS